AVRVPNRRAVPAAMCYADRCATRLDRLGEPSSTIPRCLDGTRADSMPNRRMFSALLAALLVAGCFTSVGAVERHAHGERRPVKVLIISMFGPEGQVWLDRLGPWRDIAVPGLSPDYPAVHCNRSNVCVVTTGMGHSNAAASITALVFSRMFDLSRTY